MGTFPDDQKSAGPGGTLRRVGRKKAAQPADTRQPAIVLQFEHVWQPLLAKAGLPYRKYYSTRHTFASWEDGANLRWVQRQMGHASIGQTADTYGHVQPERHETAVNGLDRYLI
jgi:integrase